MHKFLLAASLIAAAWTASARAEDPAGPSFDCAKAASAVETAICDTPDLAWYDRQMGKSYKIALEKVGETGAAALKAAQQAFLKTRDACGGEDPYACVASAYAKRLAALATTIDKRDFKSDQFAGESGAVAWVQYPRGGVALLISTIGGNDHTCSFETDAAESAANGTVTWSQNPDKELYQEACTLTLKPTPDGVTLSSAGESCQYYCGMRATLDGEFARTAP